MQVITVVGARPQFIKAAAVSRRIAEVSRIEERILHTGQHFDAGMSQVFFDELGIPVPDYHLGVSGGSHGQMTGRMLEAIEAVLLKQRPDVVLVYGDTNSTLAGALAAAKLHIPVAHVEAGLRSFNRSMPEEINRVLTDHVADLLLTPTDGATRNLVKEGVPESATVNTGDVMYDVALYTRERAQEAAVLARYGLAAGGYALATIHRQENTDDLTRLRAVFEGLAQVARRRPVVLPLHPRTRGSLDRAGLNGLLDRLTVTEPLGYLDMGALEANAAVVVTDSGGVQKEAFFHGVPCVTLRDETEWVELVEAGWNRVVPPRDAATVAAAVESAEGTTGAAVTPYGDGDAAGHIVRALLDRFD